MPPSYKLEDLLPSLAIAKHTRPIQYRAGTPGPALRTQIGGVPYWPADRARPRCGKGHAMTFYAQILFADMNQEAARIAYPPGEEPEEPLLSFHWCDRCAAEGDPDAGASDTARGRARGYDVTLFERPRRFIPDGLGCVSVDEVPAMATSLQDARDIADFPTFNRLLDIARWEPEANGSYAMLYDQFEALTSQRHLAVDKLDGWPTWQREPSRLALPLRDDPRRIDCPHGQPYTFVGQLGADAAIAGRGPWADGRLTYLFVCPEGCSERHAEMDSQKR